MTIKHILYKCAIARKIRYQDLVRLYGKERIEQLYNNPDMLDKLPPKPGGGVNLRKILANTMAIPGKLKVVGDYLQEGLKSDINMMDYPQLLLPNRRT